jgi:hypothetical protein
MRQHPVTPPAFPGLTPSGRWQFPRLQLRGSAGFSPASQSSPSGKDARSEDFAKNVLQRTFLQVTLCKQHLQITKSKNNRADESNG